MDAKLADLILQADPEAEYRDDYSGRCMYGETCPAIVTDRSPAGLLASILQDVAKGYIEPSELAEVESWSIRTDAMGLGTVLY